MPTRSRNECPVLWVCGLFMGGEVVTWQSTCLLFEEGERVECQGVGVGGVKVYRFLHLDK